MDIATDRQGNAYILYSDQSAGTTTLAKIDREHKQVVWSKPAGSGAAFSGGVAIDVPNNVLFTYYASGGSQFVLMDENEHVIWAIDRAGTPNGCCIGVDINVVPWATSYVISYNVFLTHTTTIEMVDAHGSTIWTFTGDPTDLKGSTIGCARLRLSRHRLCWLR